MISTKFNQKYTNLLVHKINFTIDNFSEMSFVDSTEDLRRDVDSIVLVLFQHVNEEDFAILAETNTLSISVYIYDSGIFF
jgi:hypothetical protein